jgi:PAS domain S-box-containing protein
MRAAADQRGSVRKKVPRMRRLCRFMDWPLRAKMAALLVVASLLPLGVETFANIREVRERLLANTAALLAARADHLADRIDTFHRGYAHSAGRISRLPNAAALCQARPEEIDRFKGGLRAILEVWPASDANIRGVAILDLSGTVRVATEEALIGLDLSYHGHVHEALRGATITSDIYLAEPQVAFEPTIAYLDPVRGTDGKTAGTAVLWVRASALWDVMKASNELAGAGSFAVLFDRQGIRIGHTYSEDMIFHPGGRLDPATVEALVAERRFGEKTPALLEDVRPFPEQFVRARSEAPDRGLFRGFASVNQKWNYGVARRFETVPWTVFYMIPEQALNAQIAQMTREKILFAGVIILIALAAATLFAAAILKPIDSLATATQSLADGHLAARVEAGHADELGRLGANFNSMAARIEGQATALQKGRDELELRVQERTAELAQTNRNLEVEITERKWAEVALRESEARLRLVLQAAQIGDWELDPVTRDALCSALHFKIFGYAKPFPEWNVERFVSHLHPEDWERVLGVLRNGLATQEDWRFECRIIRCDQAVRWIAVMARFFQDLGGHPLRVLGIVQDITDRKEAEAALRESEQRLRFTLESCNIGAWDIDLVDHTAYRSVEHDRIFGYAEMLPQWTLEDFLRHALPEYRAEVEAMVREATAALRGWTYECPIRRVDGEIRWIWFSGSYRTDLAGHSRVGGIVMDITERKNAERALHEKEMQLHAADRRLAEIVQGMTEACFALDMEWRFTFVNDRGEALLRHRREQMLGRTIWETFQKLVGTPMETNYRRAMTDRVPVDFELFSPIAERWLDIRLFPTPEGLAVFLLDIHERKQGEEALRETQARLNSTLAAGSIGTWTWDIVHDCLIADEFTARMFSIEPDAAAKGLPAEAYLRAVMEEDQPGVADGLARAIQSCGYYDIEYRILRKDGELRWLQAKGRVEGNAANFHGAVMDITERKLADATLRELEKEKQLAFEASRLKSEFLANMSHELRTPLNCIIGFTEFLVDQKPGPINPKQREYLTDIHNSSRHLLQLINDVLDLAKVEAGKIDLNPETFPLAKAIEEVCTVVKGIAQKKSVSVKWAVAPELGNVTLDQQKFKQVCYNLLANAVKFTDSSGSVELNALARDDERFELRVKDTGIGIKKEDMQRLFREFEQLESGNARRFEGTGLGLALTKKLVESQGGSIGAESEYGKGSTFFVVMPIVLADLKSHE